MPAKGRGVTNAKDALDDRGLAREIEGAESSIRNADLPLAIAPSQQARRVFTGEHGAGGLVWVIEGDEARRRCAAGARDDDVTRMRRWCMRSTRVPRLKL